MIVSKILELLFIQVRLAVPGLFVIILNVSNELVHHGRIKLGRDWFDTRGPVVDVPVVGGEVDEMVVVPKLSFGHGLEELGSKGTEEETVLEHPPLPGLIEESSSNRFHGLSLSGPVGRDEGLSEDLGLGLGGFSGSVC